MNITAVVVDDEPLARARLERFLASMPNIDLVGTGANGKQAVELAARFKPDVMLLDIEMPELNGLQAAAQMLDQMAKPPAIIFCTAYDQYAVEAFAANAVGYLLKPIAVDDLSDALRKAQRLTQLQLKLIEESMARETTLKVVQDGYLARLPASQVFYFRSEGKAVVAGLDSGQEVFVDYTLKVLTEKLSREFVRVHRNSLINKRNLSKLRALPDGGNELMLSGTDRKFLVSRRHLSSVKALFRPT